MVRDVKMRVKKLFTANGANIIFENIWSPRLTTRAIKYLTKQPIKGFINNVNETYYDSLIGGRGGCLITKSSLIG